MEIDTTSAFRFGFIVFAILLIALALNVFYPDDFSIFGKDILVSPLSLSPVQIALWIGAISIGGAIGFFTSGKSFDIAVSATIMGFLVFLFPLFLYLFDIITFGLSSYPNYQIHQEMPIIILLIMAIPLTAAFFILTLDLVSSAIHSSAGD